MYMYAVVGFGRGNTGSIGATVGARIHRNSRGTATLQNQLVISLRSRIVRILK